MRAEAAALRVNVDCWLVRREDEIGVVDAGCGGKGGVVGEERLREERRGRIQERDRSEKERVTSGDTSHVERIGYGHAHPPMLHGLSGQQQAYRYEPEPVRVPARAHSLRSFCPKLMRTR